MTLYDSPKRSFETLLAPDNLDYVKAIDHIRGFVDGFDNTPKLTPILGRGNVRAFTNGAAYAVLHDLESKTMPSMPPETEVISERLKSFLTTYRCYSFTHLNFTFLRPEQ